MVKAESMLKPMVRKFLIHLHRASSHLVKLEPETS